MLIFTHTLERVQAFPLCEKRHKKKVGYALDVSDFFDF